MMLSTQQVMVKSPPMILSNSERKSETKSSLKFRERILGFSASLGIMRSKCQISPGEMLNLAGNEQLTKLLSVVISSGKAVVSISV